MESRVRSCWRIRTVAVFCATLGAAGIAPAALGAPDEPDLAGPEIEVRAPTDGGVYAVGSRLRADFDCRDDSGVRLCIGSVADGDPLRTDREGEFALRVVGLDRAGNWSSVWVTYRVVEEPELPDEEPPAEVPQEEPPEGDPAPENPPSAPAPTGDAPAVVPPLAPSVAGDPSSAPAPVDTAPSAPVAKAPRRKASKLPAPRLRRAASMRPRAGARLGGLRPLLRWRQAPGATLYNAQVFEWRGKKWVKVRSLFPRRAAVRVTTALRPGRPEPGSSRLAARRARAARR